MPNRQMYQGNDPGKEEQTLMWAQNSYMADSGIHSGATTQAPSVKDEIDSDQLMFDLDHGFTQGFTQDQVDGNHAIRFYCLVFFSPYCAQEKL